MSIKEYFKWKKSEDKPFYTFEEVKERLNIGREKRFQNLLINIKYWFIRSFEWIWNPRIVEGYVKRAWQIVVRGWSDRDVWSLDYTFAKFALPRLIRLKEVKHGTPTSFYPEGKFEYDEEECAIANTAWETVLDKMIWSMDYIANEREFDYYPKEDVKSINDYDRLKEAEEKCAEGLMLFGKYFRCLWD